MRAAKSITRRSFVACAAATGTAALAGSVLGGCAAHDGPAERATASHEVNGTGDLGQEAAEGESASSLPYDSAYPEHEPYGTGVGVMPGRVAWVRDVASVIWDGSGYWWQRENYDGAAVRAMVDDAVALAAGADDPASAWAALFEYRNASRGLSGGYQTGQKIAIKANMNGAGTFGTDEDSALGYTNPVLLQALLMSLVEDAGAAAADITVYDACRIFPQDMMALCSEGALAGVQFRYVDEGGDNNAEADDSAHVAWSAVVSGDENALPSCVTEADYLINLANLKGHSYGITLCAKNHFGSLMNSSRLRPPEAAGIHRYVSGQTMGSYTVLVDLMANTHLAGKTVLYLLDALVVATSEGASVTRETALWEGDSFNGGFTASVFASQDPVAIDSVGADFLMNQPAITSRNSALRGNLGTENYLHEAALAPNAPSGTAYLDGAGRAVGSLGVHEHWNNSTERLYSRNLGGTEGIELVRKLTA